MARLETHGDILELVVGAFGEVSSDLNRVISAMAESRVLYLARESGRLVTDGWRSVVLSWANIGDISQLCLSKRKLLA